VFGFLRARPDRIDTLIGPGIRLEGDLAFSGGLRIDGAVHGNVVAVPEQPSVLVIGATGRVEGEVRAARMVISGVVSGSIHASELLELLPGARISGELRYGALEVHPGAVLEVELRREVPAPAPAATSQAPSSPPAVATTVTPKPIERPARGLVPAANTA